MRGHSLSAVFTTSPYGFNLFANTLLVSSVKPGSSSHSQGVRRGMFVVRVNGERATVERLRAAKKKNENLKKRDLLDHILHPKRSPKNSLNSSPKHSPKSSPKSSPTISARLSSFGSFGSSANNGMGDGGDAADVVTIDFQFEPEPNMLANTSGHMTGGQIPLLIRLPEEGLAHILAYCSVEDHVHVAGSCVHLADMLALLPQATSASAAATAAATIEEDTIDVSPDSSSLPALLPPSQYANSVWKRAFKTLVCTPGFYFLLLPVVSFLFFLLLNVQVLFLSKK